MSHELSCYIRTTQCDCLLRVSEGGDCGGDRDYSVVPLDGWEGVHFWPLSMRTEKGQRRRYYDNINYRRVRESYNNAFPLCFSCFSY